MSILKQTNLQYDGTLPFIVGDRRYGQDMTRDHQSLLSRMGAMIRGIAGQDNFLLSGGVVSEGSTVSLINVEEIYAILKASVDIPDDFSTLPPAVLTEDIIMPSYLEAQSDLSLSTATLDGVTTNYVKIAYQEIDGNTRERAKKTGTYAYEVQPSILITVDTIAPTDYEVTIAELVGDGSTTLTIWNTEFTLQLASVETSSLKVTNAIQAQSINLKNPDTWSQIGSSLSISGIGFPALAALSSTDVAFIDSTLEELRTYRSNGSTWSQVGTGLSISGISAPALATLSSTDIVFIDGVLGELRTYRSNGSTWSQVGTGLSISGIGSPALAALSSTDVAFIDSTLEELRTYRSNGSTWSQVGTGLSISGTGSPALTTLSSTDVAFIDSDLEELRTYRSNGSTWSQVGTGLSISGISAPALATLSSTDIVFIDGVLGELRTYRFNGSTWSQVGSSLSISGIGFPALAALSSTDVAFIDSALAELRTYRLSFSDSPPNPAFGTL